MLTIAASFSSLSHFIAALVLIPLSIFCVRKEKRSQGYRIALGIFCFSAVFLLLMSAVYHLLPPNCSGRVVFQRLDHAAIFLLIAGTFTPIHGICFRGFWRWMPLVTIWTIAVTGIILKSVYFNEISDVMSTGIYLGMGWLGAVTGGLLWAREGLAFIFPLLKGSAFYSLGAILEVFQEPVIIPGVFGPHEVFHIMVLAGIAFHWKFIKEITGSATLAV